MIEGPGANTVEPAASGLSSADATSRLKRDGPNSLPPPPRVARWRKLAAQLTHFFALMLWVAGGFAFVAGMPQLGVAIFVVIIVNAAFAYAQEQRAERAAEGLRDLLPAEVVVRRDGRLTTVDANELVIDDVVILQPGDRVPADLLLLQANALALDASTLTGESEPVALAQGEQASAGTYVTAGAGEGLVVAVGSATRLAEIAQVTVSAHPPRTPLAREIDRIVRTVAALAVGVGLSFFAISMLIGSPARDGFLFAVGVTVALVPEGLLPTMTLSLAMGAQKMAKEHALVRHLEAVETLGSTTFICTDKTGTLTRNEMEVTSVWTPEGSVTLVGSGYSPEAEVTGDPGAVAAVATVAHAAVLASTGRIQLAEGGWTAVGDPMEAALDALEHRLSGAREGPAGALPVDHRYAFDPQRRRESVVVNGELLVKGAPDAVLPRCPAAPPGATQVVAELAGQGLRVLAVARRRLRTNPAPDIDPDEVERDLELLGLIGLHDPPREGVGKALEAARTAGIRVAMITGDHPETARAIALQVGLITSEERVLEGRELPEDPQLLGALVDHDGVVISRVSPVDKLRIAQALQARGHVVAMTGDGVNDGPALQAADIGIAMGRSGTDVARAAADLVLLDDHFATIVVAIEHGRATFTNIRRFLTYHLTDNVAELTPFVVWALSGGRFPLALGVLQILCLDIGTDLVPALALGSEAPSPGVLERAPEQRHLLDQALLTRVFGVLGPTEAAVEMAAFITGLLAAGWRPGDDFPTGHALLAASGAAFAAVVIGQMANAFACRSATSPPWKIGWRTNPLVLWGVALEAAALAGFLLIAPVAGVLEHAAPALPALLVALAAAPALIAADAIHKHRRGRRRAAPAA